MIVVAMLAVIALTEPSWGGMHPATQLAQNWQDLSPRQRYDALRNYKEHEQRPEKEREKIERRYRRWRSMPEEERERIRRNYDRYRELPSDKREQFRRKYERWKRRTPRR